MENEELMQKIEAIEENNRILAEEIAQLKIGKNRSWLRKVFTPVNSLISITITLMICGIAMYATVTKPYEFSSGQVISSAKINSNFNVLISGDNSLETKLTSVSNLTVPKGSILMWSGSIGTIPAGWALCNGANGTPDLRDRFIVGAGLSYSVAATGGSTTADHTHPIAAHYHGKGTLTTSSSSVSGSITSDGAHTHSVTDPGHTHSATMMYYAMGGNNNVTSGANANLVQSGNTIASATTGICIDSGGSHSHSFSLTAAVQSLSGSVGYTSGSSGDSAMTSGAASVTENRPPYFALCYIMKL